MSKVILDPVTLLGESTGSKISDTALSNTFSGMPPQTRNTKAKINTWDNIKLRSFFTPKATISKMKRQPTERKKIFANDTSD